MVLHRDALLVAETRKLKSPGSAVELNILLGPSTNPRNVSISAQVLEKQGGVGPTNRSFARLLKIKKTENSSAPPRGG